MAPKKRNKRIPKKTNKKIEQYKRKGRRKKIKYMVKGRTSQIEEEKKKDKTIEDKFYWARAATGTITAIIGVLLFHLIGWWMFLYMMFFLFAFPFFLSFVVFKIPYEKDKWDWKKIMKTGLAPNFFLFLLIATVLHTMVVLPQYEDILNTPADTHDIIFEGDTAYVADGKNGILILNVSNISHRSLIKQINTEQETKLITKTQEYIIAATQENQIYLINLQKNITQQTQINATIHTLLIHNNNLLVATSKGIETFQVVEDQILWRNTLEENKNITDIYCNGTYLYTISEDKILSIFDISEIDSPEKITEITLPLTPLQVIQVNNRLYIGNNEQNITIINISEISKPTIVNSQFSLNGTTTDIYFTQDILFITKGTEGLYAINITDPDNPTLIYQYDSLGTAEKITEYQENIIIADGPRGIAVVNITNPPPSPVVQTASTRTISFGWNWTLWAGITIGIIMTTTARKKRTITTPLKI